MRPGQLGHARAREGPGQSHHVELPLAGRGGARTQRRGMGEANVEGEWQLASVGFDFHAPDLKPSAQKSVYAVPGDRTYDQATFTLGYEGFYWGAPIPVSRNASCSSSVCFFSSDRSERVRFSLTPSPGDVALAMELANARPPPPLRAAEEAHTCPTVSVQVPSPVSGALLFKPLLWASSGAFSRAVLNETSSRFVDTLLELRLPLLMGEWAEGAYYVQATRPN